MATQKISPWLTTPTLAHKQWRESLLISDRVYAVHTQALYISLFGRFCEWMAGQQLNLQKVQVLDIARFLETLSGRGGGVAANRTQRTYVAELERVFSHLVAIELRQDNPASKILEMLRITTPLRPRSIKLAAADTRSRYLTVLRSKPASRLTQAEVQNRAMNLLMLDAGLTRKELQKLVLKNVEEIDSGTITAPGHRMLLSRSITLTAEAKKWLKKWLEIRQDLKLISQAQYNSIRASGIPITKGASVARSGRARVFVSFTGKSGRPLGMRASGVVLDYLPDITVYLSAQEAMLAGQDLSPAERRLVRDKGPQALRNLCCATLVSKGIPTDQVGEFLGLRRPDQVWAMQKQLQVSFAAV